MVNAEKQELPMAVNVLAWIISAVLILFTLGLIVVFVLISAVAVIHSDSGINWFSRIFLAVTIVMQVIVHVAIFKNWCLLEMKRPLRLAIGSIAWLSGTFFFNLVLALAPLP